MHPREFLALADQLAAFQAIMSGSLKKEIEEAKAATNVLGSAQSLAERKSSIEVEEAALKDRKDQVELELKSLKEEVLAKAKQVAERDAETSEKLVKLASQEKATLKAISDLEKATTIFNKQKQESLEEVNKASTVLEKTRAEVQAYEESVKGREEEVQKKLDVIKSLG